MAVGNEEQTEETSDFGAAMVRGASEPKGGSRKRFPVSERLGFRNILMGKHIEYKVVRFGLITMLFVWRSVTIDKSNLMVVISAQP